MRMGELIRLSQENQDLRMDKRSGQINSGQGRTLGLGWDSSWRIARLFESEVRDVSAGYEIPELDFVGLEMQLRRTTGQNRARIKYPGAVEFTFIRRTNLDRNFLLAGAR